MCASHLHTGQSNNEGEHLKHSAFKDNIDSRFTFCPLSIVPPYSPLTVLLPDQWRQRVRVESNDPRPLKSCPGKYVSASQPTVLYIINVQLETWHTHNPSLCFFSFFFQIKCLLLTHKHKKVNTEYSRILKYHHNGMKKQPKRNKLSLPQRTKTKVLEKSIQKSPLTPKKRKM